MNSKEITQQVPQNEQLSKREQRDQANANRILSRIEQRGKDGERSLDREFTSRTVEVEVPVESLSEESPGSTEFGFTDIDSYLTSRDAEPEKISVTIQKGVPVENVFFEYEGSMVYLDITADDLSGLDKEVDLGDMVQEAIEEMRFDKGQFLVEKGTPRGKSEILRRLHNGIMSMVRDQDKEKKRFSNTFQVWEEKKKEEAKGLCGGENATQERYCVIMKDLEQKRKEYEDYYDAKTKDELEGGVKLRQEIIDLEKKLKDLFVEETRYERKRNDARNLTYIAMVAEDQEMRNLAVETWGAERSKFKEIKAEEKVRSVLLSLKQERGVIQERLEGLNKILFMSGETATEQQKNSWARTMARLIGKKRKLDWLFSNTMQLNNLDRTPENVSGVQEMGYINLVECSRQLRETGIISFESSLKTVSKIKAAMDAGRVPILVGAPGTGKSHLAEDVCRLFSNFDKPETVSCSKRTNREALAGSVGLKAGEEGGTVTYWDAGPVIRCMENGQPCRLEEFYRIPPDSEAYSFIKTAVQKKPGDEFRDGDIYVPRIQEGFFLIGTTNPASMPGRHMPDEAMYRQLREIQVEDPTEEETFKAFLVATMDESGLPTISSSELLPVYRYQELQNEKEKTVLPDGRVQEGTYELEDTEKQSTVLCFTRAVKAIQAAFGYQFQRGSGTTLTSEERKERGLLGYDNQTNKIDESGTLLEVGVTLTIGEVIGLADRWKKRERNFDDPNVQQADTLKEYLNVEIQKWIGGIGKDYSDNIPKVEAVFKHFGFLDDNNIPENTSQDKHLTRREFGGASIECPRADRWSEPTPAPQEEIVSKEQGPAEVAYKSKEQAVVGDETYDINSKDVIKIGDASYPIGQLFIVGEASYKIVGVVTQDGEHEGDIVAIDQAEYGENQFFKSPNTDIEKTIERGIYKHEAERMIKEVGDLEGIWKGYTYEEEHKDYKPDGSMEHDLSKVSIEFKGFMEMVCSEA